VLEALFSDQAANKGRRPIGIVSNFSWKLGHPRSIDGKAQPALRQGFCDVRLLPSIDRIFK
jgi:hypothetical protein